MTIASKLPEIKTEVKTLAGHSATYGLAEILGRAVSFLLIPVYTRYLSPSDYGVQELVGLSVEIVGLVLSLGLGDAIYRYYYDTRDPAEQNLVVSTAAIAWPAASFIVLGGISFFSEPAAALLLNGRNLYPYILLSIGNLWFSQITTLYYTYLRTIQKSGTYLSISLVRMIVNLSLNIYFVVAAHWGVFGIFTGNLITSGIFAIIFYPQLMRKVGWGFSLRLTSRLLRFSLPIVPANLASFIVNASDRYFIKAYFTIADVGLYSLGYRLGNVVFYLVRTPFMQIWTPRRFALFRDGAPPEIYAKVATYFIGIMTFVGLGISLFIQDLIKLMAPQAFWSAASFAPAVALCYVIYSLDGHVGLGILVKKKTEYWTYVNFLSAGLNILFNFIWIPRFGPWGAVAATFASLAAKIVGLHIVARRLYFVPFEWSRMGAIVGLACAFYLASRAFHPDSLGSALLWDSVFLSAYLFSLWLFGVVDTREKNQIRQAGRRIFASLA